jgi:adenylate cyclase
MIPDVSLPSVTDPPDSTEVRRQVDRILASNAFSNASRSQKFLRFVIDETLAGRASDLKEPVVAAKVFNLGGNFDRRNNSIVRAVATHVRRRLRDYYVGTGGSDTVIIDLPRGGYVPVIRVVAGGGIKPPVARPGRFATFMSLFRWGKSTPSE